MSHPFRVLLVASVLAGIGSAHAGEVANGLHLNGIRKNGVTLNRLAFNGTKAQAPQLNGIALDRVGVR